MAAGAGQMPGRQAAVAAGIGWDVASLTINKMCLSGIDAIVGALRCQACPRRPIRA